MIVQGKTYGAVRLTQAQQQFGAQQPQQYQPQQQWQQNQPQQGNQGPQQQQSQPQQQFQGTGMLTQAAILSPQETIELSRILHNAGKDSENQNQLVVCKLNQGSNAIEVESVSRQF
jgi:hypothetical protein